MWEVIKEFFRFLFDSKFRDIWVALVLMMISYFFGKYRGKRERINVAFNNAATKFRDVMIEIKSTIQVSDITPEQIKDTLMPTLQNQMSTRNAFRTFLKGKIRERFDRVWTEYFNPENMPEEDPFLSYIGVSFDGKPPYDKKYVLGKI